MRAHRCAVGRQPSRQFWCFSCARYNPETVSMISVRWQLPADPLRLSAIATQGTAMIAVVALGTLVRDSGLPVSAWYPLKAAAVFAGIMGIALLRLHGHHPHGSFGPANQVTTLRSALVALMAGLVGEAAASSAAGYAVIAALVAIALDGVDGWLARRTNMTTRFGARFDMEIDALLIQVLALLAWQYGKAGVWVIASGLLRYAFVAAGWRWPRLGRPLFASLRRQAICVVQIAGLILAVAPAVAPPVSNLVAAVALGALCYSFAVDTAWLWRR
ncbi:MAG: CDP-alcohol phosphatidyltransferase family protein [Luteitalea sp.]|nr:CDP-alcohol phosphatidyltransferase family protein [Luteitalea sp.]